MNAQAAEIKRHGRHYTPSALARFLAERSLRHVEGRSTLRVLDPACGDGELLFAVHELMTELNPRAHLTLVGYDLDPDAVAMARERSDALRIAADLQTGDFLKVGRELPQESFDVIITNPPYVRTQQLGQETAQLLAAEFGLTGRIDLTHPFVTMFPILLNDGGVVGLLCSNRFLTTRSGANVRRALQSSLALREIFDLGDTKLFDAAVLPAIAVATNGRYDTFGDCSFSSAYELADEVPSSTASLFEALVADCDDIVEHQGRAIAVKVGKLATGHSHLETWRISHEAGDDWLEMLSKATWKTFGDVGKIRVGIKTTADSVFISDDWDRLSEMPEEDLLLPLITHHNVNPWRIADHLQTRVLYPYDRTAHKRSLVNFSNFPKTMAYFYSNSDRLKARKYVVDGGREWFEIWVPHRPAMWLTPKIVFPDISEKARFAYDKSGAVVNGDCYWISLEEIGNEDIAYLMIAVANSALGLRFYDEVCGNRLYSGRRRWITQYVSKFPLPDPTTKASGTLISVVRRMLERQGRPSREDSALVDELVEKAFAESDTGPAQREQATLFSR